MAGENKKDRAEDYYLNKSALCLMLHLQYSNYGNAAASLQQLSRDSNTLAILDGEGIFEKKEEEGITNKLLNEADYRIKPER